MKRYLIIIEKTRRGYSTFCPDLPGCVATAKTKSGVVRAMHAAIKFHLRGLKEEGERIPKPKSSSVYLEILAA